jgi:Carboxypeptidase regulatory-like domain
MTAHNPASGFGVRDRACAVADRAYRWRPRIKTSRRDSASDRMAPEFTMIRFSIQIVGLSFALMLPSAVVAAQGSGSIEGIVVAAGSSMPVSRADVRLETTAGRKIAESTATLDGHFVISNIAPGKYRIFAGHEGFDSNARGSPVTVDADRKTDISVGLFPLGAISGRVVDWDGLPMVGIQVQALLFSRDDRGRRMLFPTRSVQTDDHGDYRIYWIAPGPYFVRTDPANYGMRTSEKILAVTNPSSKTIPQQFVSTYFPNSVDAAGGRLVEVRSGETVSGTDIRQLELRKHRVSGVISIPDSSSSPDVRLTAQDSASGISDYRTSADQTGFFQFDNVIPGSYLLTADTINAARVATFGRVRVDVGNMDVENVAVSLAPGFDLRIRLSIEGRLRRRDDPQLVVNLRPAIPSTPFPTIEPNGEEEYTIHRFMPGDYSVAVLSLTNARSPGGPPVNGGLYLKSALFGGSDVLSGGLHIDGPTSGILDIAMADGAQTLSGTVLDEQKQPVPGMTVVLVPAPQLRGRSDLYKTGITDAAGKFEISGIPPGPYKAFSWETSRQGEWQYPDFLDLYEDRGQPIHIDVGKPDPIPVQLIPRR